MSLVNLSLVTMQAARCIGNMNGVAKKHLISLHIDCGDSPSFKQVSTRLAQRMLLLKMIVDVEPGFAWLPCPFSHGVVRCLSQWP